MQMFHGFFHFSFMQMFYVFSTMFPCLCLKLYVFFVVSGSAQQTRDIKPLLVQCWARGGPTLNQQWFNVSRLLCDIQLESVAEVKRVTPNSSVVLPCQVTGPYNPWTNQILWTKRSVMTPSDQDGTKINEISHSEARIVMLWFPTALSPWI